MTIHCPTRNFYSSQIQTKNKPPTFGNSTDSLARLNEAIRSKNFEAAEKVIKSIPTQPINDATIRQIIDLASGETPYSPTQMEFFPYTRMQEQATAAIEMIDRKNGNKALSTKTLEQMKQTKSKLKQQPGKDTPDNPGIDQIAKMNCRAFLLGEI